jgi:hypothetical protein
MLRSGYSHVRKVHWVLDNLNTHVRASFDEVLGVKTAATLLRRIEFHYTPKHASGLNMAEIEIGVRQRQCLARCAAEQATLATEVARGRGGATPLDAASSGPLRVGTQIESCVAIMFRN